MENAKKWYDWALTPEAQAIGAQAKVSYQVPSNKTRRVPPQSPKLGEIKLINYDFAKYGSSAERTRLLTKWDKEVSAITQVASDGGDSGNRAPPSSCRRRAIARRCT